MNSQLTLKTLAKLVDFLTHIRLHPSAETVFALRNNLQNWHTSGQITTQVHFVSIFSKLIDRKTGQQLASGSKPFSNLKVIFRTYNSCNFQPICSETWFFQIGQTKKQPNKYLSEESLKDYLSAVLAIVNGLSAKGASGSSNCSRTFTDYQIQYNCQDAQEELFTNKIRLELEVLGQTINTLVTCSSTSTNKPNLEIDYGRKLSSDTNCTESAKTVPKVARKVSVYSFYDKESDITILTNDNTTFECQFQEESVFVENQEEECELLETEEDKSLRLFRESLDELNEEVDPFWLSV